MASNLNIRLSSHFFLFDYFTNLLQVVVRCLGPEKDRGTQAQATGTLQVLVDTSVPSPCRGHRAEE